MNLIVELILERSFHEMGVIGANYCQRLNDRHLVTLTGTDSLTLLILLDSTSPLGYEYLGLDKVRQHYISRFFYKNWAVSGEHIKTFVYFSVFSTHSLERSMPPAISISFTLGYHFCAIFWVLWKFTHSVFLYIPDLHIELKNIF